MLKLSSLPLQGGTNPSSPRHRGASSPRSLLSSRAISTSEPGSRSSLQSSPRSRRQVITFDHLSPLSASSSSSSSSRNRSSSEDPSPSSLSHTTISPYSRYNSNYSSTPTLSSSRGRSHTQEQHSYFFTSRSKSLSPSRSPALYFNHSSGPSASSPPSAHNSPSQLPVSVGMSSNLPPLDLSSTSSPSTSPLSSSSSTPIIRPKPLTLIP